MSATTSPKTLKRREETKARLREALLKHLDHSSFRDLRIEDVAESAGLSRSAFYFYYPDKQALLMEAAAGASAALFAEGERWWHGEGEPEELIRAALTGVSSTWGENEIVLCTAFEVSTYDPEMNEFWRQLVGGFVTATAEHIAREQEAGVVDRGIDRQEHGGDADLRGRAQHVPALDRRRQPSSDRHGQADDRDLAARALPAQRRRLRLPGPGDERKGPPLVPPRRPQDRAQPRLRSSASSQRSCSVERSSALIRGS